MSLDDEVKIKPHKSHIGEVQLWFCVNIWYPPCGLLKLTRVLSVKISLTESLSCTIWCQRSGFKLAFEIMNIEIGIPKFLSDQYNLNATPFNLYPLTKEKNSLRNQRILKLVSQLLPPSNLLPSHSTYHSLMNRTWTIRFTSSTTTFYSVKYLPHLISISLTNIKSTYGSTSSTTTSTFVKFVAALYRVYLLDDMNMEIGSPKKNYRSFIVFDSSSNLSRF